MPTLHFDTNEEIQVLINALAMTHPLVRKIMDQLQEQQRSSELETYERLSRKDGAKPNGPASP
jgi:molybdate-binding protein